MVALFQADRTMVFYGNLPGLCLCENMCGLRVAVR